MKTRKIIFLISLLIFACSTACLAQGAKQKERMMLLKVVDLLDDYEHYSMIDKHTNEYMSTDRFSDLFVPGAIVYNDLIILSDSLYLSVPDYIDLLQKKSGTTIFELRNIDKDNIEYEDGIWRVKCHFEKYVNLTNDCGIELSTEYAYGQDYKEVATIIYNEDEDVCLIEKIEGEMSAQRRFPTDYQVVKRLKAEDDMVLFNGVPLQFNPMGQAFIPATGKFTYPDPDVKVKTRQENGECKIYALSYKRPRFRIRPHYDITMGDFYKITTTSDNINISHTASEMGLDFGFLFKGKKTKASLNFGLLLSNTSIDLSIPDFDYSYAANGNADVDGDGYTRYYKISDAKEKVDMSFISVPIYLDLDFGMGRNFSMYTQFGVKPYLKSKAELSSFSMSSYEYGKYQIGQYEVLTLDEAWKDASGKPYNGFGSHNWTVTDVTNPEIPVNSFSMDGFAGAGFRIKFSPVEIEIGATYRMPVISMWKANETNYSTSSTMTSDEAPLSYTISGGEQVRMINEGIKDLKRNNIQLNIGLIIKM